MNENILVKFKTPLKKKYIYYLNYPLKNRIPTNFW